MDEYRCRISKVATLYLGNVNNNFSFTTRAVYLIIQKILEFQRILEFIVEFF